MRHDVPVRCLFTFTGGTGHFLPTAPIASALRDRGHQVAYACQPAMQRTVERAGFLAFPSGGETLADPAVRRPLAPVDRAAERRVVAEVFAGRIARERAAVVRDVALSWQPDVIVRDEMDFGAAVAAECLDLVHAGVTVTAAGGFVDADLLVGPLTELRRAFGLDADPVLAMLHRYLTLTPVPAGYRDPRDPLPATAHHIRPAVADGAVPIADRRPTRQRTAVYVTLGTVFHQESGDLFPRVLAGLTLLDVDVLVTVGREIDPAELGARPPRVRVERYVPLDDALSACDTVVSHAGSGTVIGTLAHGLPSVLLPMGADQPWNADRCRDLGVARVLDPLTCTPEDIRDAVVEVSGAPEPRAAAERLRDEIAALPGSSHGALLLERLAEERRPIER